VSSLVLEYSAFIELLEVVNEAIFLRRAFMVRASGQQQLMVSGYCSVNSKVQPKCSLLQDVLPATPHGS
jgi:hypothetical protein